MELNEAHRKNDKLIIWQQNVNKSSACQHDLISSGRLVNAQIDLIALQEPSINFLNKTIAARDWIVIYPTTHITSPNLTRSIFLIRSSILTDSWSQIDFPSGDVTAIQIKGSWGKISIFNIYNDCTHDDTIHALTNFHRTHESLITSNDDSPAHLLWVRDFNRHHPHWDNPEDSRLFIKEALTAAKTLIEAVADAGLDLSLPSGTATHQHNVTKCWT